MVPCSKMAVVRDELILEGEFALLSKRKVVHRVTLTRSAFFFHPISSNSTIYEEKCVNISDIIGCHGFGQCGTAETIGTSCPQDGDRSPQSAESKNGGVAASRCIPQATDPSVCGIVVFAYPFRKKLFSSKKVRTKQVLVLEVSPASVESGKRRTVAETWRNVINCLCRELPVNVTDIPSCVPPPRGRMLLLINPHSGPGKAYTIFRNEIAPMLYEACIPYKAVVTEYAGHAGELMKTINLSEWYGVVVVSGDGLIFETINGIMQRDDWATSVKFPVGCLPGGSGNALSCSINYAAGEPLHASLVLHSTFVLVKHHVVPMDLVVVHIPDRTIFSFLSVTWGIVADIDFESEKYRTLGEARFTVGAIRRIIGLRSYRGRVSFLPIAEYTSQVTVASNKVLTKVRRLSLDSRSSSKSTFNSEDNNSSVDLQKHNAHSPSAHLNGCSVQHNHSITIISDAEEISVEQETYHVKKPKSAPVPTPLLRPLDQDVPANWVSLEENFILAIAVYKTHLGSEMLVAPDAHLADGHIHLIMIKEGISRNALLNLFLNFDQGQHINSPYVDIVKVLAFRIEPATKNGNIMVDGERFDPAPIQGQVLPGVARIMAIK
ncbi:hypothetical protein BsWGS_20254 [Bradybaena similaris]